MSTSKTTSFLSEIAERKPIPSHKLAYFQARLRHNLYDFIISRFQEMEKTEDLTKAELARRIGCEPALITRRLGAPGNWTLDTVSDLLIGIAGEELDPQSKSVLGRAKRNYDGRNWYELEADEPKPPASTKAKGPRLATTAREASGEHMTLTSAGTAVAWVDSFRPKPRDKSIAAGPSRSLTSIVPHV